jgi:hypothetical protein
MREDHQKMLRTAYGDGVVWVFGSGGGGFSPDPETREETNKPCRLWIRGYLAGNSEADLCALEGWGIIIHQQTLNVMVVGLTS